MPFYEANLSIHCIDGSIYGLISSDIKQLRRFLKMYDHEGASIYLTLRPDPETFKEYEMEAVYRTLEELDAVR